MRSVTEDLLDVVRLETGRLVLRRESANLVEMSRQAITHLQASSDRHRLTLSTRLADLQAEVDKGRTDLGTWRRHLVRVDRRSWYDVLSPFASLAKYPDA